MLENTLEADIARIDALVLERFADNHIVTAWIGLAAKHIRFEGLPARIAWLGHGERARLGVLVNEAVGRGELAGPVAFTRDHLDAGAVAQPYRETENMPDGSDAISDWPLLNALLNCAAQADLVAIHGGGIGLRMIQTGAGGDPARGLYTEVVAMGTVAQTADLLRQTAVKAGGFVANARTPLSIPFIRDHAAAGAVSYALDLGRAVAAALPNGAGAAIAATAARVSGRIVCRGELTHRVVETKGGFDLGMITIAADAAGGRVFELSLCNEYMTVESRGPRGPQGERLATFPDLIATLALDTGLPVSAAQTAVGQGVALLVADKANLPLGGGMRDPTVYPEVEAMIGKDLATYALAGLGGEGR